MAKYKSRNKICNLVGKVNKEQLFMISRDERSGRNTELSNALFKQSGGSVFPHSVTTIIPGH